MKLTCRSHLSHLVKPHENDAGVGAVGAPLAGEMDEVV
jgi:hypothetical protein